MSEPYTPTVEIFRAVYGHMCSDWSRGDALAEFDRIIERVRREAKVEAVATIRTALDRHPPVCDKYDDTNPITCGWKYAVADIKHTLDQLEQEGKNDE